MSLCLSVYDGCGCGHNKFAGLGQRSLHAFTLSQKWPPSRRAISLGSFTRAGEFVFIFGTNYWKSNYFFLLADLFHRVLLPEVICRVMRMHISNVTHLWTLEHHLHLYYSHSATEYTLAVVSYMKQWHCLTCSHSALCI